MKKLVNSLTIGRMLATFVLPIIWSIFDPWVILIVVALVLLTDFFDGLLARKFHVQTLFGSVADQIADKMFGIMILLIISKYYPIFYFILLFELIIAFINVTAAIRGAFTKSSFLGRVKMWLVGVSIIFGLVAIYLTDLFELINYDYIINLLNYFNANQEMLINTMVLVSTGAELMVAIDYSRHIIKELRQFKKKIKYQFKSDEELMKVLFDTEYYLNHKNDSLSKHFLKQ